MTGPTEGRYPVCGCRSEQEHRAHLEQLIGPFRRVAANGTPTQNHRDHVHVDTYETGTH